MRCKLTCPESAHLEEVEYIEDPERGLIVDVISCSVFAPPDAVVCERECARRLNLKRRQSLARRDRRAR